MEYQVRPITDFTVFTTRARKPNPFRASWSQTLKRLGKELDLLSARNVVLELACEPGQVRRDGMLRADAKVTFPGVRIAFESKHGPLTYAVDTFEGRYYSDPPDWQINVRAIALALEALRQVDRYGVTRSGEQYQGWKMIGAGPGTGVAMGGMTDAQAWDILYGVAGIEECEPDVSAVAAWRRARAAAHPDRNDGDRTAWDQVEQAARVLGLTS